MRLMTKPPAAPPAVPHSRDIPAASKASNQVDEQLRVEELRGKRQRGANQQGSQRAAPAAT